MKLSVNGADIFVATGGREFDRALPTLVLLHGAGFGRLEQVGTHRHAGRRPDQSKRRYPRRMPRRGFERDQRPHGVADQIGF